MLAKLIIAVQFFFSCIVGIYFLTQLKGQSSSKTNIYKDSSRRSEELENLRKISLTKPLSEKVRPQCEEDIIGQESGMKALKIALCGPSPQHILIYGAPGVGKTAAARIALEIAKASPGTPFKRDARFVEIDATTLRFDERSIADPLIGSVHDPIYQGAGAYGQAGVPQPKPGAVTKAHGGVLFIDEIGELHSIQMNKLLKVLEDRKVFLESSYYSRHDENIPRDIHDIFGNGLPADFRLIGATTRSPEDIPPALRSRCIEIFFEDLKEKDILKIIENVTTREKISIEEPATQLIGNYALNGRDAVNIVQTAHSLVQMEGRWEIKKQDIEWVIQTGHYMARGNQEVHLEDEVGRINGLAVMGNGQGIVLNIEAVAKEVGKSEAKLKVSGIIEEEEIHGKRSHTKRKSMALNSVENVLTLLKIRYNVNMDEYLLHINYTSGMPIDGPSAGIAMFCVLYSAIFNKVIPGHIAMTGELSIRGKVCPVGGVYEKVNAAKEAGIKKVFIPKENMQDILKNIDIEIVPVEDIEEIIAEIFDEEVIKKATSMLHA
ncbi:MAG: ATP-dependent protease LonB [Cellulosilyticum sp.]|nr:ATP-dependent protease LonB [Cellulosilyticum sp.]